MKKVLIIEDDPIIAHIYRSRLEKENYQVETCADGQSGFYRIHEFRPDAVLLDLMLPKMNGVEILKKIRAQSQFQRIPIIVFTNAYVPNMIQESFGAGATQVFNKASLTPRQILDALHTAMTAAAGEVTAIAQGVAAAPAAAKSSNSADTLADSPFHSAPPVRRTSPSPGTAAAVPVTGASAPATTPTTNEDDDAAFQAELHKSFIESAPDTLAGLRKVMQEFGKASDEAARLSHLLELYRKIHALTGSAGIAGVTQIAQMAAGLEVLVKELHEKPKNLNASTLRTVAHSIDFIGDLFRYLDTPVADTASANILVVDDEILSRRAITYALEKAGLKSSAVEDPQVALNLVTENTYDLIFLDVQMPGMDGFDLCTKIRALSKNKTTPVVFVTSLTDFKSRARSSLSGGSDLIAKPFMFIELSVKALAHVLRGRLPKNANSQRAA